MRQMRARAFALRDVFPDVLRGLPVAEELMDTPAPGERFMGAAEVVKPEVTTYPQEQFDKNLPAWRDVIAKGRKTPDEIIAMAQTKFPLTDEQKKAVRASQVDTKPAVTAGDISKRFDDAQDVDALNEAAALIDAIADPVARKELDTEYSRRLDALTTD